MYTVAMHSMKEQRHRDKSRKKSQQLQTLQQFQLPSKSTKECAGSARYTISEAHDIQEVYNHFLKLTLLEYYNEFEETCGKYCP